MRRRSPLIGFTEAELGFVIAAVIAATASLTKAESQPPAPPAPDSSVVVRVDSGTVVTPIVDSAIVKAGRRDELPYCSQLGLEVSPLEPITILGATRYVVHGSPMSVTELKARLADAVTRSTARQCKYKLFFKVKGDLSHRVVRKAKAPFFAKFYISDIG
jgi:hypothetical protein